MAEAAPVVVIGAGIGGLSAAVHLAAGGRRVLVLEQNATVGGKMSEQIDAGFRWDSGPSVITMRHVFTELFAAAGRRLDDYLDLLPVEPLTRYRWRDGTTLDASRDPERMAAQIAAVAPQDVAGYRAYLAYAARIRRVTGPKFIDHDPPTFGQLARTPLLDALAVDPLRTMDGAVRRFVRSPYLRQMLDRFATYVGASPFLAPATLNVIADVELSGGVFYPRGGVYALARAYERLARELGVEIRTGCPVERIALRDGAACAVMLADGARVEAQAVVANVDVATVYERLLPREPALIRRADRLRRMEPSCSGFALMLGVEGEHPQLAHHNLFFSDDYRREFEAIFRRGVPPDDPTIYLAITSKTDADHAPPGCENWFVLVNAPPLGARFDWSSGADAYRDRVLATLAAFGLDVRDCIRVEHRLTPLDLERRTGARRGALYGASSNDRWSAFRRPHNRAPDVRGLYFCGGTAHPGGGVPMVTLSGRAAARMVLADFPSPVIAGR